jgi:hypothetical protein
VTAADTDSPSAATATTACSTSAATAGASGVNALVDADKANTDKVHKVDTDKVNKVVRPAGVEEVSRIRANECPYQVQYNTHHTAYTPYTIHHTHHTHHTHDVPLPGQPRHVHRLGGAVGEVRCVFQCDACCSCVVHAVLSVAAVLGTGVLVLCEKRVVCLWCCTTCILVLSSPSLVTRLSLSLVTVSSPSLVTVSHSLSSLSLTLSRHRLSSPVSRFHRITSSTPDSFTELAMSKEDEPISKNGPSVAGAVDTLDIPYTH